MSVVLDDRDPAIQYSGNWEKAGVVEEYRGTTSWTETPGATASVSFRGRGITVFGTIKRAGDLGTPVSSYVVDSDPSTSRRFEGEQMDRIQRLAPFYSISNLEFGDHVLTITNESSEGTFYLDYVEVTGFNDPETGSGSSTSLSSSSSSVPTSGPTPEPPLPSHSSTNLPSQPTDSSASSSTSTPSPSNSISAPTGRSSPSQSSIYISPSLSSGLPTPGANQNNLPTSNLPDPTSQDGNTGGAPVGAIVGGVVGAIAAICIAFLAGVLCKRRRRRHGSGNLLGHPEMQEASSQPYITPYQPEHSGHYVSSGLGPSSVASGGSLGGSMSPIRENSSLGHPGPHYPHIYAKTPVAGPNHNPNSPTPAHRRSSLLASGTGSPLSGYMGKASSSDTSATADPQQVPLLISADIPLKLASDVTNAPPHRLLEADPPPQYQI